MSKQTIYAVVDYPEPYVQPLVLNALNSLNDCSFELIVSTGQVLQQSSPVLQITAYESLDFEHAHNNPKSSLICAYTIRKALIRKHYLSNTISTWLVKHPESVLSSRFKACTHFELDFAEFLDEALVDAWDLNESMSRNETATNPTEREWWILKPGMSDGGNGIRLFSSLAELQSIFEEWEENEPEIQSEASDEDQGSQAPAGPQGEAEDGGAMTSQLRHFIAQPYIPDPLLFDSHGRRKFHVRTYVVAVGALRVYVYREMLALFAAKPYASPAGDAQDMDLTAHLTNTCFQDDTTKDDSVFRFWDLQTGREDDWQETIFADISQTTGEVFEAAAREQMVHFQTLPNAFEIFGVDFLVDEKLNVWLLELNAYPDFKQTGDALQETVVGGLFKEIIQVAVLPFFDSSSATRRDGTAQLPLVRHLDLGRH